MKRELALSVLLTLSAPLFAQTLPDEINYPPYQQQFQKLTQDTESALGELNGAKSDLEEIRQAIINSLGQISSLQNQNSSLSNQISANQNRIPQLRSELNSEEYQISGLNRALNEERSREQSINSTLQDRIRSLRPAEERLSRALQNIRSIEADLNRAISQEQSAARELSSLQSRISQVESSIARERSEQQSLRGQLASLNARISQSESKLSSLRSQLSSMQSELSTAEAKVNGLRSRVSEYQSEVNSLRASGAPASDIQAAERKLSAASNKLNEEESSLRSIQSNISSIRSDISREENELASLRRDQTSLPSRIAQSEREEQSLVNERSQLSNRVQAQQRELISAQNIRQIKENQLRNEENQNRGLQVEVDRLRSQVASLENDLQNSRRQSQNLQGQLENTANRAQNLRRNIADLEAEIPRLQQSIRSNNSQILSLEGQVQSLRNSEQQTVREISSLDRKYNDLVVKRNSAQGHFESRLGLYRRYESEASDLGSSQVKGADEAGKKDGSAFAKKRSADLSRQLSNELGEADGKHIAIIRGEISGFNIGYPIGMSSESDIKEGARQGAIEGKKEAIRFAQTQLKPQFFEEILVSELSKPVSESFDEVSIKMAKAIDLAEIFADLPALSASEMQEANQIKTALDKEALSLASQIAELKKKVASLSQAENSYQSPSTISYGSVSCSQVYKGVTAFKKVCEASYASDFSYIYKSSHSNIYTLEYPSLFQSQYTPLLSAKRSSVYDASFAGYQKTAKEEGIAQGKVVIFNQTFEQTRAATYEQEIGPATEVARGDARVEVSEWVSTHPMITASSVKSDLSRLRGGDVGSVVFSLKNISPVALKENIVIQVKETQLAEVSSKVVTVSNLKGQSLTSFKDLKFTVSPSARSGQKIVIKGDLLLPGDKYQSQRKESFTLEKSLAANPAFNIQTVYDSTPKIKNIFGYKTHKLAVKIAPKFERLDLGYQIELVPAAEFKDLITIPNKLIDTKSIESGALKEFAFNYKFHKNARKKTVPFNLNIIYDGEVIQSYKIEMKPYRALF